MKFTGLLLILSAFAGNAFGFVAVAAPEIDTNSIGTGVALVAGLLLIVRGRKK